MPILGSDIKHTSVGGQVVHDASDGLLVVTSGDDDMPEVMLRWSPLRPGVLLVIFGGLSLCGPPVPFGEQCNEDILEGRRVIWSTRRNARAMRHKHGMHPAAASGL